MNNFDGEKLETDQDAEFNEFSLTIRKLEQKKVSEDPVEDVALLYSNQAMNETYKPFRYSIKSTHTRDKAEAKNDIYMGMRSATSLEARSESKRDALQMELQGVKSTEDSTFNTAEHTDRDGTVIVSTSTHERIVLKEFCPYCQCKVHIPTSGDNSPLVPMNPSDSPMPSFPRVNVITTTSRGSEFEDSGKDIILETDREGFDRHKRQCGFYFSVLPRFRHINADIQNVWLDLKKGNELIMAKTLAKAIRSFEKRQALNNRVLTVVNLLVGLGMTSKQAVEDFTFFISPSSQNSEKIPPLELVEEQLQTAEIEAHDLLVQLRQLELNITHGGDPATIGGDPLLDGDSDDERLDGDVDATDEEKKRIDDKSKGQKERQKIKMYIELVELCQRKLREKRRVLVSHLHKDIGIHDFECLRLIGRGSYAHVYLVRRKKDGCYYALKAISKDLLTSDEMLLWGMDRNRNINNLLNERIISCTTTKFKSDAFVNLKGAFQVPKFCCLVTEVCPGGDCQTLLLNTVGYLNEETVKLIVAEVVSALLWLHKHGVLHRDIKPGNIFITRNGHIKIGDLGICAKRKKEIGDIKQSHSTSFTSGTGTPGAIQSSTEVVKSMKQTASSWQARIETA